MSLTISSLTVRYGDHDAVHDVSLSIPSGTRYSLMGPSGSGKSSLLRAIAGIVPSSGSIEIDGQRIEDLPVHKRPIGLMFQDYALFPHMSVGDNVAYGLRMQGRPRDDRMKQASGLLDLVGLGGYERRDPMTLSGGEQQRVALARTLAPEPRFLMLDEPLGSLDLALREDLMGEIRRIVTEVGVTTIYVTHDRDEAFSFGTHLGVIDDGRLVSSGTPDTVWTNPGSLTVARLIGHTNILESHPWGDTAIIIPDGSFTVDEIGAVSDHGPTEEKRGLLAEGIVIRSVFSEGSYMNAIAIDGATGTLTVRTTRPLEGARVSVAIDGGAVTTLVG